MPKRKNPAAVALGPPAGLGLHRRAPGVGLHAAGMAGAAFRASPVDDHVPDLPGRPSPQPGLAGEDQPAADAGAPEGPQHRLVGLAGAEVELALDPDLHVVADPDRRPEFLRKRLGERERTIPAGQVAGAGDDAGLPRDDRQGGEPGEKQRAVEARAELVLDRRGHRHDVAVAVQGGPDLTYAFEELDAIRRARGYGVFHILGDPVGFDFRAEQGGAVFEMGDEVKPGATLVVEAPKVPSLAGQPASTVQVRLLYVAPGGKPVEVATSDGSAPINHTAQAGAYRVEVYLTPGHLSGYMGSKQTQLLKKHLWVFANPIYVR